MSGAVFRYEVQTDDGHALSGEVSAVDHAAAVTALENAGLRVLDLAAAPPTAKRRLRGADFQAFNQQLAHLTRAGLPLGAGLKLIADDLGHGRLAESVRAVANAVDRGMDLGEAFEQHHGQFPPRYARLVAAGVGAGKLPAVLLNLGRHLEMTGRLKRALWQAVAYPLVVLMAMIAAVAMLGLLVLPAFAEIYEDFDTPLPPLTHWVMSLHRHMWWGLGGLGAVLLGVLFALLLPTVTSWGSGLRDRVLLPLPIIGAVLKRSLLARWCDLLAVGVSAGLDLPAALRLAGDGAGADLLRADGHRMIATLEQGAGLDQVQGLRVVPASVPASIHLASEHHDLGSVLADLAVLYEQQAETRIGGIQATLAPFLLLVLAVIMGLLLTSLFLPLIKLMQSIL